MIRNIDSIASSLSIVPSLISAPQTSFQLTCAGAISSQIPQGGSFSICIQTPNVTAATYALASATTTLGSNVITMPSTTGAAIGQQVSGVGIQSGSFITAINPNVSITISIPATANGTVTLTNTGGNFTAILEASTDNVNWVTDICIPKTIIGQNAATSALNQIGLWQYEPSSIAYKFVRVRVISVSSIPFINIFIDSIGVPGAIINLPYISGLTASIPTGIAIIPPIEASYLSELTFDLTGFAGTSQIATFYQSNDPSLVVLSSAIGMPVGSTSPTAAGSASGAAPVKFTPNAKYFLVKITHTALTTFNIGGITAKIGMSFSTSLMQIFSANLAQNMAQIAGSIPNTVAPGGATNKALGVYKSAAANTTPYSAQAWAAASGNAALLINDIGIAACYDINLSAWTVGTSTGLVVVLQWSPDNGTTWYDQWMTEPMTAIGHAFIPVVNTPGRVRMRWFHVSGSATTATVTVTAMNNANVVPPQYQYFDRTSGVGSGTAVLNTNSSSYNISGTKAFTVVMNAGTSTAVGSFKAQMSMDGSNWYDASAAVPIAATTANLTLIPITSGVTGRFIRVTCTAAGTLQVINSIGINAVN